MNIYVTSEAFTLFYATQKSAGLPTQLFDLLVCTILPSHCSFHIFISYFLTSNIYHMYQEPELS